MKTETLLLEKELQREYISNGMPVKYIPTDYTIRLRCEKDLTVTKGFKANYLRNIEKISSPQYEILLLLESYYYKYSSMGSHIWLDNLLLTLWQYNVKISMKRLVDELLLLSEIKKEPDYIPLFSVFSLTRNEAGINLRCIFNNYF